MVKYLFRNTLNTRAHVHTHTHSPLTKIKTKTTKPNQPGKYLKVPSIVLASFMTSWHKLKSFWKKEPQLRKCSHHMGYIFLIDNWYGSGQPTVGGATPELGVLGCLRRQAEWVIRSKPVSSTPLWDPSTSVTASGFLPWVSALPFLSKECDPRVVKGIKPSPLQVDFGHGILPQQ